MSVKIRLRRMGKKKQPHYRIVVTDSRAPRDGRFVEIVGYYNPIRHPAALKVDLERVEYWVGQGAILSPTVGSLVSKARAGGDESVALAGVRADGEAGAEAAAANGEVAEAAADPGDVAEAAATAADADVAGAPAAGTDDADAGEAAAAPAEDGQPATAEAAAETEDVEAAAEAEDTPADESPAVAEDSEPADAADDAEADDADDAEAAADSDTA